MALACVPYEPTHLSALQALTPRGIPPGGLQVQAVTLLDAQGPCACFGISSAWPTLGFAWFEERTSEALQVARLQVGKCVLSHWKGWLAEGQYQRIECRVPELHARAHRLVKWLGFRLVVRKPHYDPWGGAVYEYVFYPRRDE